MSSAFTVALKPIDDKFLHPAIVAALVGGGVNVPAVVAAINAERADADTKITKATSRAQSLTGSTVYKDALAVEAKIQGKTVAGWLVALNDKLGSAQRMELGGLSPVITGIQLPLAVYNWCRTIKGGMDVEDSPTPAPVKRETVKA